MSSSEALGPTSADQPLTMEVVLEKTNLQSALSRVIANKGAAGVDGMACRPRTLRRLSRRIETLALVLVLSLQKAQLRLWQQDVAATPLASLDPDEPVEQ